MRIEEYLLSLAAEVDALRDRVRHLIDDRNWQTDGEWKESVIRQVLRRHLPASVSVGRGFVVTATDVSHQIDVLIFDSSKPILFRDGDLAFVTPDAVLGIIEVKSRATPPIIAEAAAKLAPDMLFVRLHPNSRAFAGVFAFEGDRDEPGAYLRAVAQAAARWENRVDFVCVGRSRFIRYWHLNPEDERHFYEGWRSYDLPGSAPGYFIHNVIDAVSPDSVFRNRDVWFPSGGKEPFRDGEILGTWPSQRPV
jgi:uncharacterized protein DUF6602